MCKSILSDNHWHMNPYRQRMTTAQWKKILLNDDDRIIFRGRLTQLKAKKLGSGVVEVYKEIK